MAKKIINTCLLVGIVFLFSFYRNAGTFKSAQLKSARVKTAYQKKWPELQALLNAKKISPLDFDLYLRVFKAESLLEIWVKNKKDTHYALLKTIPVCAKSGILGPKRRQGDGQVPEGFYEIGPFNPYSSYHLSLQINYPNKSDFLKKSAKDPGGEIMIHGYCVTIGCIPLQNEPVEELYVLCVEARNRNSAIHTDIYPYRFNDPKQQALTKGFSRETLDFWESLKKAYAYFETQHSLPKISVDKNGNYILDKTEA